MSATTSARSAFAIVWTALNRIFIILKVISSRGVFVAAVLFSLIIALIALLRTMVILPLIVFRVAFLVVVRLALR